MSAAACPGSQAQAWLRALERTAPIAAQPERTLPMVIEEFAELMPEAPALLSDGTCMNYGQLASQTHQCARWTLAHGLRRGDTVCLLMGNRPEYLAIWLGVTSVGVVVALLNTNLGGASLAHTIEAVSPQRIVVDSAYFKALETALPYLTRRPALSVWSSAQPSTDDAFERFNPALYSGEPLRADELRRPMIADLALYIYTSGTTGLPKAAKVSHARIMQWSQWFAGMMMVTASDRMYNCLPMYHSVGGVQATGAMLVAGGSVVLRERFSASAFWKDVVDWDCTLFQYIGELCRYLLQATPSSFDQKHHIRLACGNGLSLDIWNAFVRRFQIPRLLEFYASTEGTVSLFNVEGKPGAIGHIPSYLAHRFSPPLVRLDDESNEPVRNNEGLCIRCGPDQVGEALGKLSDDPSAIGTRFDGYTSSEASQNKILENVFALGDAWFRTGDLMRRDREGYFYFVDRIGDTFRRKGENVATTEVAAAICAFPGVRHSVVYGVQLPGVEGRVGMAAMVVAPDFRLAGFRDHLVSTLPGYARPCFLRMRVQVETTGTWKYSKTELQRQGFDPALIGDPLYVDLPSREGFIPLGRVLHDQIQSNVFRF